MLSSYHRIIDSRHLNLAITSQGIKPVDSSRITQIVTSATVNFKNHLVIAQKRTKSDSLRFSVCGFCEKVTKLCNVLSE